MMVGRVTLELKVLGVVWISIGEAQEIPECFRAVRLDEVEVVELGSGT